MKNKYVKSAKISEAKFRQLVKYFDYDLNVKIVTSLINLNRNTVNRYLWLIRKRIAEFVEHQLSLEDKVEVNKLHSPKQQMKEKRQFGVSEKATRVGIYLRGSNVYTEIISDCNETDLKGNRRDRAVTKNSSYHTGGSGYDAVVDIREKRHYYLNKGVNRSGSRESCYSVIDSFMIYVRQRLKKFYGVTAQSLYLHLKECEFRFNHRDQNLTKILLKIFREKPL